MTLEYFYNSLTIEVYLYVDVYSSLNISPSVFGTGNSLPVRFDQELKKVL